MPAVTRKQYKGAAAQTTITNALGAGDTTITIAANTGWPSAAGVPFFVVISPGTASEEKCLTTISGTTLTLTRAQDDTSAQSHSSGATIYPVYSADDADEANLLASTLTTRGDLLTMGAGPDFARVGIGAADTVLKSDGTDVSYGTIVAANIASDAVTTAKIQNDAVTTAKILNANVTGAKLANAEINDQTASYTLVVGDRNKRVIMNVATANTVTVDDSIFAESDTIFIANKGAGVSTITAGAGVTINVSGSLALAQYGGGTLIALSASTFTFFPAGGGVSYGTATGGTAISPDPVIGGETYRVLQFTSSGTLTVTVAGKFEVAGVGGGGGSCRNYGGGGGGGGFAELNGANGSLVLETGTYAVTVGAGGAGSTVGDSGGNGNAGSSSTIGVGGFGAASINNFGTGGASVGGNSGNGSFTGGAANGAPNYAAGGGAGDSANGGDATGGGVGGAGGAGTTSSFTGTSTTYGGGGGGAGINGAGAGGAGGGATGNGSAGTANSGGGGGGITTFGSGTGGAGGSGIIIVRFKV